MHLLLGHQDEFATVWPLRLSEGGTNFVRPRRGIVYDKALETTGACGDESAIGFARAGHLTDRVPTASELRFNMARLRSRVQL